MYYNYLNRDQLYLRSYRTHNLWFCQYQEKVRQPRVVSFHIGFMKRMAKSYSSVSANKRIQNLMFLNEECMLTPNFCDHSKESFVSSMV